MPNHRNCVFLIVSSNSLSRWVKVLSVDVKAQKIALQHRIEAIDTRHRYGHSLHLYYEEWCKADAGQPFFYWLDVGDGKEVDLPKCPRSKLRQQCIKYLGTQNSASADWKFSRYKQRIAWGKMDFCDEYLSEALRW